MRSSYRLLVCSIASAAVVALLPHLCCAQGPPDTRSPKTILLTSQLFVAIRDNDDEGVRTALKNGSDPNGRNWLGFTPLMWASARGRQSQAELLLSRGARINDPSPYGSALSFALIGRHEKLALALISKGASTHPPRLDGATPLMLAAANGFLDAVSALAKHGENVNSKDAAGDTALIYAARCGRDAAIKELIALGSVVNTADSKGQTALMEAASGGHVAAVTALVSAHAAINAKDRDGNSAILLAARYCTEPKVIEVLLHHGADAHSKDSKGNTPLSLAVGRGHTTCVASLRLAGLNEPTKGAPVTEADVKTSVDKSLVAVQSSMKKFADLARCASCHHQGLGLMTVGLAGDAGFKVDGKLIGAYMTALGEDGKAGAPLVHEALAHPELVGTIQAVDIGDMPIGAGYLFGAMIANHVPANPGLAEAAQLVAGLQKPDGRWVYGMEREPMQGSQITTTALVTRVLKVYGSQDPNAHIADRIQLAKSWLLKAAPVDSEGKAFRLLGLKWAGASDEECAPAAKDLVAAQRADGGWSQFPAMASDAYATGISLCALRIGAGAPADNETIHRGVHFLLTTQDEDGTWYVSKRTMPSNNYFDTGFPHGESQYASFAATCWATMGLLQTIEPRQTAAR